MFSSTSINNTKFKFTCMFVKGYHISYFPGYFVAYLPQFWCFLGIQIVIGIKEHAHSKWIRRMFVNQVTVMVVAECFQGENWDKVPS